MSKQTVTFKRNISYSSIMQATSPLAAKSGTLSVTLDINGTNFATVEHALENLSNFTNGLFIQGSNGHLPHYIAPKNGMTIQGFIQYIRTHLDFIKNGYIIVGTESPANTVGDIKLIVTNKPPTMELIAEIFFDYIADLLDNRLYGLTGTIVSLVLEVGNIAITVTGTPEDVQGRLI